MKLKLAINQLWKKKSAKRKEKFECRIRRTGSSGITHYDPIGQILSSIDGVSRADVNYLSGEVFTEFDPSVVTVGTIVQAINSAGFKAILPSGLTKRA